MYSLSEATIMLTNITLTAECVADTIFKLFVWSIDKEKRMESTESLYPVCILRYRGYAIGICNNDKNK